MAYARSQLVRAPDGRAFEVCASPRGDLLAGVPEGGPGAWLSTAPGMLGLVSLAVNLVAFRGRWRVVVRDPQQDRLEVGPALLGRADVRRRDVEATMRHFAEAIAAGEDPRHLAAGPLA